MATDDTKQYFKRLANLFGEASRIFNELSKSGMDIEISSIGKKAPFEQPATETEPSEDQVDEAVQAAGSCGTSVQEYLAKKNIEVVNVLEVSEEEKALLTLADVVFKKYHNVREFLYKLKRFQGKGVSVYMDLNGKSQEEISDITLLANLAHKAGLLPRYHYKRSPYYKLYCDPPATPLGINFFTGEWLELAAYSIIQELMGNYQSRISMDLLSRAQIRLPNDDQFDLDICLLVGDDDLVWVEAKTTEEYNYQLPKYSNISKLICKDRSHSILLCSEFIDNDEYAALKAKQANMTASSINEFEGMVQSILESIAPSNDT